MNESILQSIKKLIGGIPANYTHFDEDVITQINTAFGRLYTLGVGPIDGFSIQDETAVWTDFMEDGPMLNMCKTYVELKVRLYFDPPTLGTVLDKMQDQVNELEWVLLSEEEAVSEE